MSLLSASDLEIRIGPIRICGRLNIRVEPGQRWCILGSNGAGKTTLLHVLAGLRKPQSGSVAVEGVPLAQWERRALARRLGILFQDYHDAFPCTVMETALTGCYPHTAPWAVEGRRELETAAQALAEVKLSECAGRMVDTLSGGERRRLAIATLLVQKPHLWLLDEPSNHLDLHHQVTMLQLLHERAAQGAVLMTMHDVNLAMRIATHALLMVGPDELICGAAADVVTRGNLERLYRHPLRVITDTAGVNHYFPV